MTLAFGAALVAGLAFAIIATGTSLPGSSFEIDNDANPVNYSVTIVEISEEAPKPSDSARWGESVLALKLEEV